MSNVGRDQLNYLHIAQCDPLYLQVDSANILEVPVLSWFFNILNVQSSFYLICRDLGCHVDGFVAVVAHTHVLSEGPVTGRAADVLAAAHTATEVALRLVRPGKKVGSFLFLAFVLTWTEYKPLLIVSLVRGYYSMSQSRASVGLSVLPLEVTYSVTVRWCLGYSAI